MTISARGPYNKEETHNVSEVNRVYSNPFTFNSYRLQKQSFFSPYKSLHFQRYVMSYFKLDPPVNVGQNVYYELHSIVMGWNEFLPTQINTVFPGISAHALISALHPKKRTPLGQISNKRPSRISAPSPPPHFLKYQGNEEYQFLLPLYL